MIKNITCGIIKPDAIKNKSAGKIIEMIERNNFEIKNIKMIKFTKKNAELFYKIHEDKKFYESLCNFMSSGPSIIMLIYKKNAIEDFRKLIGSTNPSTALDETIRKKFGTSIEENAIHGSDSEKNSNEEYKILFN
jgi:nucleoside-diphosphate kinase